MEKSTPLAHILRSEFFSSTVGLTRLLPDGHHNPGKPMKQKWKTQYYLLFFSMKT